jgi:ubiquinone/menaquinone biosynthesis C-methylase UbiE
MERADPAYKGQAAYGPFLLSVYDPWVIGFMAKAVWHIPPSDMIDRYRRYVGRRHLDVGPGTGYFLDKADLPAETQITLLDPNRHVLERSARRLAALRPTTVEADVLKPLPVDGPYDSAAISYVLHCLPGPPSRKATAIGNIANVLGPQGVLFGGTVLGRLEKHSRPARAFLWAANKQGGFDNRDDTAEALRSMLDASFELVEMDVVGSTANFVAQRPRASLAGTPDQGFESTPPPPSR